MGFRDLNFRWHNERFDLYDVELLCGTVLQQLDNNGDWVDRSPSFLDVFSDANEKSSEENSEYENPKGIKYTNSRRTLRAKAKYSDDLYSDIFLGVPEDKQTISSREKKIEYFNLSIREIDVDDMNRVVKSGSFGFIKDNPELSIKGFPYAELYAPSDVFDHIEKWLTKPNIQLSVSINRKGWQWTGPIGDRQIYLDTENGELAEFAGITVRNKLVAEFDKFALQEEAPQIEEDYSQDTLESNTHLLNKLTELGGYMRSVKLATWIIAICVIFLAVKNY